MRSFPSVVLHPHLQFPSDFSKAEEKHNYGSWRNGVSSEVNVNQAWDLLRFPQQDKSKMLYTALFPQNALASKVVSAQKL